MLYYELGVRTIEKVVIRWGHETQITDIDWLWKPLIPYGKVTIIEGDGGDGKTTMILTIAAMLSQGTPPPTLKDGRLSPSEPVTPVTTFYLTNEDEIADSSLKRFLRAGGDMSRFSYCKWPHLAASRVVIPGQSGP